MYYSPVLSVTATTVDTVKTAGGRMIDGWSEWIMARWSGAW